MITNTDEIPITFGAKKLGEILGVSEFTARNLMHSEGFPLRVFSERNHRVYKSDFLRWMEGERFYPNAVGGFDTNRTQLLSERVE
jgi:hypothetical protein